jgi:predicted PurR-regulated permease PerM
MAAISMNQLITRSDYAVHQLMKRKKNWAQREPGVIVVFVIVFLVAILVIAMFINKKVSNTINISTSLRIVLTSHIEECKARRSIRYPTERVDE